MIDNGKYYGSSHYPCLECDSNNAEDCCGLMGLGFCELVSYHIEEVRRQDNEPNR